MNLGSFMNPEYPIFSTTLCYLEREDAYLMLHRSEKAGDYNHRINGGCQAANLSGSRARRTACSGRCGGNWPDLTAGAAGLLTFLWGNMTEFIHLYTADRWEGEMIKGDACKEGVLEWVPKEKVTSLPIWEGDKIFFRLLKEERPYFSLKLVYEGDTLKQAVLDGKTL